MRFLILNVDYSYFLQWLYDRNPELRTASFDEQLKTRNHSLFGVADFYSRNLRRLGHEAWEIHANNEPLQKAWMQEFSRVAPSRPKRGLFRMLSRSTDDSPPWFYEILSAQIQHYRPDVILNQDIAHIRPSFLKAAKVVGRLIVGQHASPPFDRTQDFSGYDLMISSFPPTLDFFRSKGISAEKNHLAFEESILLEVPQFAKKYDVTFIGTFFPGFHDTRRELIEFLCTRLDNMNVWGPDPNQFAPDSAIRKHYRGPLWGRELYEVIAQSKIVLNIHADAGPYANNMRLYEVTGMGSFLLTDSKQNLSELFEPDKEVATFSNAEQCLEAIEHYLANERERETMARQGQLRTLKDHSYTLRMKQLNDIISKYTGGAC